MLVTEKQKEVESIDSLATKTKAKSFKTFLKSQLQIVRKNNISMTNQELIKFMETQVKMYINFEEKLIATFKLNSWKGQGSLRIIKYPKLFRVIEPRKKEKGDGFEIVENIHDIPLIEFIRVLKAILTLEKDKTYHTRIVAKIWCKENDILENAEGKKIFDDDFNFANISGCRETYFSFYYPIKILEHYKLIKYNKTGLITKLKDNVEIQTEFNNEMLLYKG